MKNCIVFHGEILITKGDLELSLSENEVIGFCKSGTGKPLRCQILVEERRDEARKQV